MGLPYPGVPVGTTDWDLSVGDPDLGKSRLLSRQCDTCVFAPGNRMHLTPGRLRSLVADRYDTQALQLITRLFGFVEVDPPQQAAPSETDSPK